MMKKMMKKLVAVMMMSLTLAVPLAQSVEAAGHKHAGGPHRQEMRMERRGGEGHEQRMSKPGGHREQRMDRHEPTHGKHQPMSQAPSRGERRDGGRDTNDTAVLLGRLLLGAILGRDI